MDGHAHAPEVEHALARTPGVEASRLVLREYASARPLRECFARESFPLPEPGPGQLLLRTHLLSIDICAHTRMQADAGPADRLDLGEVMPCATVSQVVASRHRGFREGEYVLAHSGWQTHEVVDASEIRRKLYPNVAPVATALGIYGLYGYIAWSAVREVCQPKAGDTAVVAAAAGPIGATVCQLLQARQARVVAVTSGEEKCAHVRRSFDPAVVLDRDAPGFEDALRAACPDGVDIFVENVDGRCIDPVLPLLNRFARVPLCGALDVEWDGSAGDRLPVFLNAMLERQLQVRPFTSRDITRLHPQYLADPQFISELGALLRSGQLRWHEEVMEGLDALPQALERLVRGENLGKLLVRLD